MSSRLHAIYAGHWAGNIGDSAVFDALDRSLPPGVELTFEAHTVENWRRRPQTKFLGHQDEAAIARALDACDAVIIPGTTVVTDLHEGEWPIASITRSVAATRARGRPVHAIGVGVYPSEREAGSDRFIHQFAEVIDTFSVRDAASREALLAAGVDPEHIALAADMAWLLDRPADTAAAGDEIRALTDGRPFLAVNVVHEDWAGQDAFYEALASDLEAIYHEAGLITVFFCNEIREGEFYDAAGARHVMRSMKTPAALLPARWRDPEDMIARIAPCACAIGMRYHFCLFAALAGAPWTGFSRGQKCRSLLAEFGKSAMLPMGRAEPGQLARRVFDTLERRDRVLQQQRKIVDHLQQRAQACRDHLLAITLGPQPPVITAARDEPVPVHVAAAATSAIPQRLLIVRPDAYGDLVLFEPALRMLRETWEDTEITVLIQQRYADLTPLLTPGIRWLTTKCNPYRQGVDADPRALKTLQDAIESLAPDCVVSACYDKTWLEAAAAAFAPRARQISLGPYALDPVSRIIVQRTLPVRWSKIYPEIVPVERDSTDWEKNLQLARHLTGRDVPRRLPALAVPGPAQQQATAILRANGLPPGGFAACFPAGTANVTIKAWPPAAFGQCLAWLEKEHGLRPLLMGHENERDILEAVELSAREAGASPAMWTGASGQIALMAALLQQGRLFFGNDTGALHVAGALDKPVVGIFGGGHWPRFRPAARRSACVLQPLPCFGCNWECAFDNAPCVKTISPDAVRRALQQALASDEDQNAEVLVDDGVTPAERNWMAKVTAASRRTGQVKLTGPDGGRDILSRATLERLVAQLDFAEADRAARLKIIEQQGEEMAGPQQGDGAAAPGRRALTARLAELDEERSRLLATVERLQADLAVFRSQRERQSEIFYRQFAPFSELLRQRHSMAAALESAQTALAASELRDADLAARLAAQTQALAEALESLGAARDRVRHLQAALAAVEKHWLVSLLKPASRPAASAAASSAR